MRRLRQTRWEFDNYVIPGSEHRQQSKFEAWPGDWGYEYSHGGDPLGRWSGCAMPIGILCPSFMPRTSEI